MNELFNHLWQSTAFAGVVAAVCFGLRNNHARCRYWLWLAASLKFAVPFALLISFGRRVEIPVSSAPLVSATTVEAISTTFSPSSMFVPVAERSVWPQGLALVWALGAAALAGHWFRRWLRVRSILRVSEPLALDFPIPARTADSVIEPGVFGVWRPVLLLPDGLAKRLPPEQLQVILAHELCHVRFRDNLWSALHMLVNVVFWFHPVVWWIGAKMVQERERACDESVIRLGRSAEVYAQSIVNVCKFYLESPLPCASGVTGANLKQQIREIMTMRPSHSLTLIRRTALVAVAIAAIGIPSLIGYLRAQTLPPEPRYGYEVVSIRPSTPGETNSRLGPGPQGGLRAQNNTVLMMMAFAYDKREFQFADVPNWVKSLRYDLTLTPDKPEGTLAPGMKREEREGIMDRQRQRMQAALRDRFGLVLRAETKELPMYGLVIAKGGHKLSNAADLSRGPNMNTNRKEITIVSGYLSMFTQGLSTLLGRHVANETGLDGPFDFKVQWTPDSTVQLTGKIPHADEPIHADDAGGVSIFTALTEQLGLKLEPKKGPVPVLVIEKIEKPSEN